MEALDVAAVTFSLATMGLYHIHLYSSVILGRNSKAQLAKMIQNSYWWAKKHQEKDDAPTVTLGIQTLRNTILVAVFVGGNAITTGLSYANSYDGSSELNLQIRSIVLSTLCICSFLCFALVIRFSAQLGYLVSTSNIPHYVKKKKGKTEKGSDKESAPSNNDIPSQITHGTTSSALGSSEEKLSMEEMNRNIRRNQLKICTNVAIMNFVMFSLGFRFLFVAFPFAFYIMGPIGLIISTFCMFLFLIFFDYGVSALSNIDTLPQQAKSV
eukprot:gene3229-3442_t